MKKVQIKNKDGEIEEFDVEDKDYIFATLIQELNNQLRELNHQSRRWQT